jgi:hypothetical protein
VKIISDLFMKDPGFALFVVFVLCMIGTLFYVLVDSADYNNASQLCRIQCAEEHSTSRYDALREDGVVKCICLEQSSVLTIERN